MPLSVTLGAFRFDFPEFWAEVRPRSKPPLHLLNSIAAHNVTFDVTLVEGRGTEEEKAAFLGQSVQAWDGELNAEAPRTLGGVAFDGVRTQGPRALEAGPGATVDTYAAAVNGDLLCFSVAVLEDSESNRKLRDVALRIVEVAVARRLNLTSPN